MSIVSGILSGLGSIFGGLFGNYQQKKANEYNREMLDKQLANNKQLAQYQYDLNLQQWQRENAYNNPANQLARLRAAGLNPHLIYGHGSVSNTSAPSPKYESPQAGALPMAQGDIMGNILSGQQLFGNIEMQVRQMANLGAQNSLTKAMTAKALSEVNMSSFSLDQRRRLDKYVMDAARLANENAEQDISVKKQRIENYKAEYKLTENNANKVLEETQFVTTRIMANLLQYKFDSETFTSRKKQIEQSIAHTIAQVASAYQGIRESKQRISESQAREDVLGQTYWQKKIGNDFAAATYNQKVEMVSAELRKSVAAAFGGEMKLGQDGLTGQIIGLCNSLAASIISAFTGESVLNTPLVNHRE